MIHVTWLLIWFFPRINLWLAFLFKWMRMKWQKKRFFQSIKSNQRGRLFDGQSGGTNAQRYIYYKTSSGDNVMNEADCRGAGKNYWRLGPPYRWWFGDTPPLLPCCLFPKIQGKTKVLPKSWKTFAICLLISTANLTQFGCIFVGKCRRLS